MPRMASVLAALAVMAGGQATYGAVFYDEQPTSTAWTEETDWSELAAWSGQLDEGAIPLGPMTDFGFVEEEEPWVTITMVHDGDDFGDAIDGEVTVTSIDDFCCGTVVDPTLDDLASQSGTAEGGQVVHYLDGGFEITSTVPEPTAIAAAVAMATAACAVGRRSRR